VGEFNSFARAARAVPDNGWIEYCNYVIKGVEITEETIAADLIETVLTGGGFVAQAHSPRHFQQSSFLSKLLNRQGWEAWSDEGRKDVLKCAVDFVRATVGDWPELEPVCTPEQFGELNRIVAEASAELGHSTLCNGQKV